VAAGLEHTLRKDPYFVDGPYRPQLLALETFGPTPLARDTLPLYVMPCGALIWRANRLPECFSTHFLKGGGDGGTPHIFLHCFVRYREEVAEGVWLPEALFIATRWAYHKAFARVLRLFAEACLFAEGHAGGSSAGGNGSGATVAWGAAHVKELAAVVDRCAGAPRPGQQVCMHVAQTAVVMERPGAHDLPLADVDHLALFRCLDLHCIQRLLVLLMLGEPQVLLVADDAHMLMPLLHSLTTRMLTDADACMLTYADGC
jgi:hypothetical protein